MALFGPPNLSGCHNILSGKMNMTHMTKMAGHELKIPDIAVKRNAHPAVPKPV